MVTQKSKRPCLPFQKCRLHHSTWSSSLMVRAPSGGAQPAAWVPGMLGTPLSSITSSLNGYCSDSVETSTQYLGWPALPPEILPLYSATPLTLKCASRSCSAKYLRIAVLMSMGIISSLTKASLASVLRSSSPAFASEANNDFSLSRQSFSADLFRLFITLWSVNISSSSFAGSRLGSPPNTTRQYSFMTSRILPVGSCPDMRSMTKYRSESCVTGHQPASSKSLNTYAGPSCK
mmetsp:Transcript_35527/g.57489  ORF Transcript_35527/g.57489 Transcript_35527/m.57489 type:complete len:234 (-) Transcript_35527:696-1397(-)